MLWRPAYETVVREGVVLPDLGGEGLGSRFVGGRVVLGAFGWGDLGDLELWVRLLESDFEGGEGLWEGRVYFSGGYDRHAGEVLVRPSWRDRILLVGSDAGVADLVGARRAFAVCAGLSMAGPPTEEAWERFSGVVRVALGD